ncbi:MAG TPA: histidine phosphatase family protein, partial [Methylomirabilota bacterium]|nr:histidine phosphatase family protein [Methylomirabilota bacterium]
REHEAERTRAVRARAGERFAGPNLVLVTHGANVLPLTGIQPAPGELVVLAPEGGGRFRVAGRLAPASIR